MAEPSHNRFTRLCSFFGGIGVIILYVILWAQINFLGLKYNLSFDVTKLKQHTLTAATRDLLRSFREDVKITAFYVGIPPKYLEDLLNEYQRLSNSKITAEIIDPLVSMGYAAQFGSVINAQEKKAIVASKKERRDVDFTNSPLTEEMLTNALLRVARPLRHIYFLTGHGENKITDTSGSGLTKLAKRLAQNNILTQELMLGLTKKIPDDCDELAIAGAREELTEVEAKIIQDYLKLGGDALFLIENTIVTTPDLPLSPEDFNKNPSFNEILHDWGIHINNDVVVDIASHVGDEVGAPATRNYVSHPALIEGLDYTFYIRPRSIEILKSARPSLKVAPFVLTASDKSSWGETNRMLDVKFDEVLDIPGPVVISTVIFEPKSEGEKSDTRLIVFTDSDFLTNDFIDSYSNARMGLNVINWLAETDYKIFNDKKDIKVERLDLTSQQKRHILLWLLLIPVLIAAAGLLAGMRKG